MQSGGPDTSLKDAKALGATRKMLAEIAGEDDEAFALWPCNADAFSLLLDMRTQLRAGAYGPFGLDYTAIEYARRSARISQRAAHKAIPLLMVAEREMLSIIAEIMTKASA
jgi:hypothetical protein